ncbi:MAG TPA: DUF190 domain-containing protein [Steroidobacteraceae bacterium]|nr:DUF190 domain-containing protein [Steroidobacteraceae bacterium]
MDTPITLVRLYLPEMTHSTRKAQLEKVLRLLREQSHVHGVTVSQCVRDAAEHSEQLHYETVGDVLRRNPDPPLIIEFFDESAGAGSVRQLLRTICPESHTVYWDAHWEKADYQHARAQAEVARHTS